MDQRRQHYYDNQATDAQKAAIDKGLFDYFTHYCFRLARDGVPVTRHGYIPFRTKDAVLQALGTWNVETHCLQKVKHCMVRLGGSAVLGCIASGGDANGDYWEDGLRWLRTNTIVALEFGQKHMQWTPTKDRLAEIDRLLGNLRAKLAPALPGGTISLEVDLTAWDLTECDQDHVDWVEDPENEIPRDRYRFWFCLDTFKTHMQLYHGDVIVSFFKEVPQSHSMVQNSREYMDYRQRVGESYPGPQWKTMWTMSPTLHHTWRVGDWHFLGMCEPLSQSRLIPSIPSV